jgi:hypothetical protein
MDDASLQKLSISPGKLSPKFNKDVTEYSVVVGSGVKELKVSPLTSDNNACYSISVSVFDTTLLLTVHFDIFHGYKLDRVVKRSLRRLKIVKFSRDT